MAPTADDEEARIDDILAESFPRVIRRRGQRVARPRAVALTCHEPPAFDRFATPFALVLAITAIASVRWLARPEPSRSPSDEDASSSSALLGQRIFEQRCAICHTTTSRSAQGPGLGGVFGRRAAAAPFGYSTALRASNLTWDRATLDRFLTAPAAVVPGTTMPMSIPDETERSAVLDYLATLAPGDAGPRAVSSVWLDTPPAPPGALTGRAAFGDFRGDGPGVRRRITRDDLPPPFATPSAQYGPDIVARPPGAHPYVPAGFRVDVFAHNLLGPRLLRVSPSGDLFVAESRAGDIRVLRAASGAREAEQNEIFARGLDRPFGIAFYPPGPAPKWI